MAIIPDIPEEIMIQMKRAAFISRKVIDHDPDENYDIDGKRILPIFDIEMYPGEIHTISRKASTSWFSRSSSKTSTAGLTWVNKIQAYSGHMLPTAPSFTFTTPFMASNSKLFNTNKINVIHVEEVNSLDKPLNDAKKHDNILTNEDDVEIIQNYDNNTGDYTSIRNDGEGHHRPPQIRPRDVKAINAYDLEVVTFTPSQSESDLNSMPIRSHKMAHVRSIASKVFHEPVSQPMSDRFQERRSSVVEIRDERVRVWERHANYKE